LKRAGVGFIGGLVVIIGIIAIPYPGPGWLIVFAGLGILSKEFPWAKRILDYAKVRYDAWDKWIKRQSFIVRGLFWLMTCILVVVTLWLLNGYGLISDFLHLGWDWIRSPLPFFN
jgi:uncharacterized protein (TIGR02611 family)